MDLESGIFVFCQVAPESKVSKPPGFDLDGRVTKKVTYQGPWTDSLGKTEKRFSQLLFWTSCPWGLRSNVGCGLGWRKGGDAGTELKEPLTLAGPRRCWVGT